MNPETDRLLTELIEAEEHDAVWATMPRALRAQVLAAFLSRDTRWMDNLRLKIYPQFDAEIMAYIKMLQSTSKKIAAQKEANTVATEPITIPAEVTKAVQTITERIIQGYSSKRSIEAADGGKSALNVSMDRMVEFFALIGEVSFLGNLLEDILQRTRLNQYSLTQGEMSQFEILARSGAGVVRDERLQRQHDAELTGQHQGHMSAIGFACTVAATIPDSWWVEPIGIFQED